MSGVTPGSELPMDPRELPPVLSRAARIARSGFGARLAVTMKLDGSPVTAIDKALNHFLRDALLDLVPSATWLSEEEPATGPPSESEWTWVVDPLDGTKEFVAGIAECAISVALLRRTQIALGGVINPITEEWGVGGPEGWLQFGGVPKPSDEVKPLEAASISVSRTESGKGIISEYRKWFGSVRPVGSVAYKLLRVASGMDDLTFTLEPKWVWDVCGGVGLVQAAGGVYRSLRSEGNPVGLNVLRIEAGTAAGGRVLVEAFCDKWKQRWEVGLSVQDRKTAYAGP